MRISDWSSDVCSSDLPTATRLPFRRSPPVRHIDRSGGRFSGIPRAKARSRSPTSASVRSEEHTSELQSLMRISYAVFCLKKKNYNVAASSSDASKNQSIIDISCTSYHRHTHHQSD